MNLEDSSSMHDPIDISLTLYMRNILMQPITLHIPLDYWIRFIFLDTR